MEWGCYYLIGHWRALVSLHSFHLFFRALGRPFKKLAELYTDADDDIVVSDSSSDDSSLDSFKIVDESTANNSEVEVWYTSGTRQWLMNWSTSQMLIHKITSSVDYY